MLAGGRHVTTAGLADALLVSRALVVVALRADGGFRRIDDDAWELEAPRAVVIAPRSINVESPAIEWLRKSGRWCGYQQIADGIGWNYQAVVTFFYNLRANGRMGTIRQRTIKVGVNRRIQLLWEAPTV